MKLLSVFVVLIGLAFFSSSAVYAQTDVNIVDPLPVPMTIQNEFPLEMKFDEDTNNAIGDTIKIFYLGMALNILMSAINVGTLLYRR